MLRTFLLRLEFHEGDVEHILKHVDAVQNYTSELQGAAKDVMYIYGAK